jgi:hypothetical protein
VIEENTVYLEEGDLLARYIVNSPPNETIQALYAQAISKLNIKLDDDERRLWNIIRRHHFMLRIIDGGLALVKPHSAIRRKVYTMLAILEASTEYCDHFLPKPFSPLHSLTLLLTGACAVFAGVIGFVFIKLMGTKCH